MSAQLDLAAGVDLLRELQWPLVASPISAWLIPRSCGQVNGASWSVAAAGRCCW